MPDGLPAENANADDSGRKDHREQHASRGSHIGMPSPVLAARKPRGLREGHGIVRVGSPRLREQVLILFKPGQHLRGMPRLVLGLRHGPSSRTSGRAAKLKPRRASRMLQAARRAQARHSHGATDTPGFTAISRRRAGVQD